MSEKFDAKKLINEALAMLNEGNVVLDKNYDYDKIGTIIPNAKKAIKKGAEATKEEGKTAGKMIKTGIVHAAGGKTDADVAEQVNKEKTALATKLAEESKKGLVKAKAEGKAEGENAGVQTHLARAGKRAVRAAKDFYNEHPTESKVAGATAAAVAAGMGAKALVNKLRGSKKAVPANA